MAKPKNKKKILDEGQKLAEDAWLFYELLIEVELESGAADPTLTRWEPWPHGAVKAPLKSEMLIVSSEILEKYRDFRRNILQI